MKKRGKRYFLSYDEAVSVLPNEEYIHTFINNAIGLIGADWEKNEVLHKLKNTDTIELCGEQARKMGHGICCYNKSVKLQSDILFIATDEDKLLALEKENGVMTE